MSFSTTHFYLLSGLLATSSAGALMAQPVPAEPVQETRSREQVEEIVVTAQKSGAVSVQKVPIAVTAISASQMEASAAVNVVDLARLSPNTELLAASRSSYANFYIRGIGLNGTVKSIDPAISVIMDGMTIDYPVGTLVDVFGVESVEILKGPQGILFGRNATGGAVSFRTRRPGNQRSVKANLTGGSFGRVDWAGLLEGPLTPTVAANIAIQRRHHEGYFKDRNAGIFVPSINNPSGTDPSGRTSQVPETSWLIRPVIRWQPSDRFDATLIGEHVKIDAGGIAHQVPYPNPLLSKHFGYTPQPRGHDFNADLGGYQKLDAYRLTGEMNWKLGAGTLTSISGWRQTRLDEAFEGDETPFTIFEVKPGSFDKSEQFNQEIRYTTEILDGVTLLVGAVYDKLDLQIVEKRLISALAFLPPSAPPTLNFFVRQKGDFRQKSKAAAGFANLQWRVVDWLRLSGGGRYSWEKKTVDVVPLSRCAGPEFANCPSTFLSKKKSWTDFSPRLAADVDVMKDVLLYLSWTNGFRSGQFNSRAARPEEIGPVDPEYAESFEGGFKATFWDRRARVNIALFHTKYTDIQKTIPSVGITGLVQDLRNAASATIKGFEVETTLRPLEGLQLEGSVGFTDASYDSFEGLDLTGDRVPDPDLAKELKFERVPKWTFGGAMSYTRPIGSSGWEAGGRVSYAYRSRYFLEPTNSPLMAQSGFGLLDASFSLGRDPWKITAFGKNLSNEVYRNLVLTAPGGPSFHLGDPRTYGLTVSMSY